MPMLPCFRNPEILCFLVHIYSVKPCSIELIIIGAEGVYQGGGEYNC
jgi:hypothetical protein